MKIANFDLNKKVLIIAEIGNNHEGSVKLAGKMIRLAAQAGADAVKFQTIVPEKLISADQKDRLSQLRRFQLSYDDFNKLHKTARREGVMFLSTPFDVESVKFLKPLVPAFKIASADNNFFPLIEAIARTGKPIILSTGLSDLRQVKKGVSFIKNIWRAEKIKQDIAVLHCVASYPAPGDEANLLAIKTLKDRIGGVVGYSDHTIGINAAVLSAALGAGIIEKHFTLDKNYSDFRDHRISADPVDFKAMVDRIREAGVLLGSNDKRVQKSERDTLKKVRRFIAAGADLKKDSLLGQKDIMWVRASGGIGAGRERFVLGRTLKRPVSKGEVIMPEDIR